MEGTIIIHVVSGENHEGVFGVAQVVSGVIKPGMKAKFEGGIKIKVIAAHSQKLPEAHSGQVVTIIFENAKLSEIEGLIQIETTFCDE